MGDAGHADQIGTAVGNNQFISRHKPGHQRAQRRIPLQFFERASAERQSEQHLFVVLVSARHLRGVEPVEILGDAIRLRFTIRCQRFTFDQRLCGTSSRP